MVHFSDGVLFDMKGIHQHSMLMSPASWWFSSVYILLCLEMAVTRFVSFGALST